MDAGEFCVHDAREGIGEGSDAAEAFAGFVDARHEVVEEIVEEEIIECFADELLNLDVEAFPEPVVAPDGKECDSGVYHQFRDRLTARFEHLKAFDGRAEFHDARRVGTAGVASGFFRERGSVGFEFLVDVGFRKEVEKLFGLLAFGIYIKKKLPELGSFKIFYGFSESGF